ncbi:MAG: uroporphyrinogen-III synthase [Alistipes indistinctus]
MKIKSILVSQPAPAAIEKSPYNEIISKHHLNVKFHPFIKVEGISLKEFRSQRIEILDHTAVIFTSRTTIDSFFRICERERASPVRKHEIFCNTEAVALYLQKISSCYASVKYFSPTAHTRLRELLNKHKREVPADRFGTAQTRNAAGHGETAPHIDKVVLARTVSQISRGST